ncbi:putative quinol monooxygenase [Bosea sp. BK604]|uniref:putative quinol monooxygenase n=1 Tax=Bosea sp. BK604 TaxID=2512180 RepID=UPI001049670F|nr:putative quinol monooxygenase [Bosea sp. BK604]TCR64880.1 quinol monooxygenase YgiN [Bosea sp. BK604]
MSDPVIVIARARVMPEARERFLTAAHECIAVTRREHGCLAYDVHESATEPHFFVFLQSWEHREHVDRHFEQPHYRSFLSVAGACVMEPPVIEVIEPRSVDRL